MCGGHLVSIVDDDDSLRNSLANLIRSGGFRTEAFSSAAAFLASDSLPDTACLILDVRMPGMNGPELQRHLVATGRQIPVVFITSYVDDEARARALQAGALAFLYKPCREQEIFTAIRSAVGGERKS